MILNAIMPLISIATSIHVHWMIRCKSMPSTTEVPHLPFQSTHHLLCHLATGTLYHHGWPFVMTIWPILAFHGHFQWELSHTWWKFIITIYNHYWLHGHFPWLLHGKWLWMAITMLFMAIKFIKNWPCSTHSMNKHHHMTSFNQVLSSHESLLVHSGYHSPSMNQSLSAVHQFFFISISYQPFSRTLTTINDYLKSIDRSQT